MVIAPLAATLSRRNLVIGLSWYGLLIANAIVHIGGVALRGIEAGGGVITATLFFIPAFFWMVHVVRASKVITGAALAISIAGGVIAHILLGAVYGLQKAGLYGAAGVLAFDLLVIATPLIVGWLGSGLANSQPRPSA